MAGGGGDAAERATAIRMAAAINQSDVLLLLGALQYLRFIDGEKHLVYLPARSFAPGAVEDDREIARVANDARVALHVTSRNSNWRSSAVTAAAAWPDSDGSRWI
jgi:hypothetical protein